MTPARTAVLSSCLDPLCLGPGWRTQSPRCAWASIKDLTIRGGSAKTTLSAQGSGGTDETVKVEDLDTSGGLGSLKAPVLRVSGKYTTTATSISYTGVSNGSDATKTVPATL